MKTLSKLYLPFILLLSVSGFAQNNNILKDSLWSYSIHKYACELPLLDSSCVYVGADVAPITCLYKQTGKLKWKLDMDVRSYKKGFLHTIRDDHNGRIFFNGESNDLYAAEKATGKILWKYELKFDDDVCSRITILHDTVFINPAEPIFVAITTKGKIAWKTNLTSYCVGYAIDKNIIFCQLVNGGFCVLDRSSGKIIKSVSKGGRGEFFTHPPCFFENTVVMGNDIDSVSSFDKNTFERTWTIYDRKIHCSDNGNLYCYNDTLFIKLDPTSSNPVWRINGNFGWFLQPTVYNNKVYLQTRHRFYIINNETGELLYECPFNYKSYTKPIVENGIIYMGFTERYVAVKDPTFKIKK